MDLSKEEENAVIRRIISNQEKEIKIAREWSRQFGENEAKVSCYVVDAGARWERFICELIGISPDRFHEVLNDRA